MSNGKVNPTPLNIAKESVDGKGQITDNSSTTILFKQIGGKNVHPFRKQDRVPLKEMFTKNERIQNILLFLPEVTSSIDFTIVLYPLDKLNFGLVTVHIIMLKKELRETRTKATCQVMFKLITTPPSIIPEIKKTHQRFNIPFTYLTEYSSPRWVILVGLNDMKITRN